MDERFWSSVVLTGKPTDGVTVRYYDKFWSSVVLTGNPTGRDRDDRQRAFWSSVVLTGNPTSPVAYEKRASPPPNHS